MNFLYELFQNRSGGPWAEGYAAGMEDPNEWVHRNVTKDDKVIVGERMWIARPIYVNGELYHKVSTSRAGWFLKHYGKQSFVEKEEIETALIVPKLEV
jgi:hypothetical protein